MDSESGWMVHCKACGKRVSGNALVCPHCGKVGPRPNPDGAWMIPCRECGKEAFGFARHCWNCGAKKPGERPLSRGCLIFAFVAVVLVFMVWLWAFIGT